MAWKRRLLYDDRNAERRLRVAAVSMRCDPNPESNREKIAAQVTEIAVNNPDVELVFFGEAVLGWYDPSGRPELHLQTAESIPGPTTDSLARLAQQHGIHICFGMSEIFEDRLYNTQVLVNPQGEIQALHRKRRLKENTYTPGPEPVTLIWIKGIPTALLICSDAASLSSMRALRRLHPELILLSLADDEDENFFMAQCNARLYDAWIVTANRFGEEETRYWSGHMVVSDPLGELRVAVDSCERVIEYDLGFAGRGPWIKRVVRRVVTALPLVFELVRNGKQLRQYF